MVDGDCQCIFLLPQNAGWGGGGGGGGGDSRKTYEQELKEQMDYKKMLEQQGTTNTYT